MSNLSRSIVISLVVGVLAFLVIGLINHQALRLPDNIHNGVELAGFILAVFAGCVITAMGRGTATITDKDTVDGDVELGTVKWFNIKKGYGFITRDSGDDVFVHFRNLKHGRHSVSEGQRVSFVVVSGDKGLQADEVETIES